MVDLVTFVVRWRANTIPVLKKFVDQPGDYQWPTLRVLLHVWDSALQKQIINGLIASDELKLAVISTGIAGDPQYVPWLIEMMERPELASLAGEAFNMITGVDIDYEDLVVEDDDEQDDNLSESDDGESELDESFFDDEEDLDDYEQDSPVPDLSLVAGWWQQYQPHFNSGTRYLAGKVINEGNLFEVLQQGFQRQRMAAGLELGLLHPNYLFFEMLVKGMVHQGYSLGGRY